MAGVAVLELLERKRGKWVMIIYKLNILRSQFAVSRMDEFRFIRNLPHVHEGLSGLIHKCLPVADKPRLNQSNKGVQLLVWGERCKEKKSK